ncbi:MAG: histidine phosphatase family protein [Clostridiales Family XIII bacterium]|jgi:probable phosphoglycerate mutase|nr:histidine phosphatase family protein [Clostridiales Family XIII bacterium]
MTEIHLIRAAEAECDLYRIACGHGESNLTDRGRRQSEATKKRFAGIRIDGVYTSDLYRARAVADTVCGTKTPAGRQMKELREIRLGEWEGKNRGNIAYEDADRFAKFKTAPDLWHVNGAETRERVLDRMLNAVRRIVAENEGKAVAVVSHAFAVRFLMAELAGMPPEKIHELPCENNTAVSVINAEGGALRPAILYDDGHLRDADFMSREKPYVKPDFDTDLYFHALPWVEYGGIMADAVECVWRDAGEDRPFDRNVLLNDAALLPTTVGFVGHEPAAFLQMGLEPGRITLLCTHPGCRKAGLGVQLIGRAAMLAGAAGADRLRIALPKKNPHRKFFLDYGFVFAEENEEGRDILEKDLRFDLDSPDGRPGAP